MWPFKAKKPAEPTGTFVTYTDADGNSTAFEMHDCKLTPCPCPGMEPISVTISGPLCFGGECSDVPSLPVVAPASYWRRIGGGAWSELSQEDYESLLTYVPKVRGSVDLLKID